MDHFSGNTQRLICRTTNLDIFFNAVSSVPSWDAVWKPDIFGSTQSKFDFIFPQICFQSTPFSGK
jgi:hypothetical protein